MIGIAEMTILLGLVASGDCAMGKPVVTGDQAVQVITCPVRVELERKP